ncbi:hypothetical protein B0H19DRAFT_1265031 [Mycena capillaripes]|nr:hypothetical protein B0H19DRAFT_1265031 [Mycena capillaripes]
MPPPRRPSAAAHRSSPPHIPSIHAPTSPLIRKRHILDASRPHPRRTPVPRDQRTCPALFTLELTTSTALPAARNPTRPPPMWIHRPQCVPFTYHSRRTPLACTPSSRAAPTDAPPAPHPHPRFTSSRSPSHNSTIHRLSRDANVNLCHSLARLLCVEGSDRRARDSSHPPALQRVQQRRSHHPS